ncbi:hypothetical protein BT96DRAFT_1021649 [Gymnopus androsaceus JB14]|uniref:Uncharacterized protein n=1 Tax=Gymnopus androsaceus JB14 TaxID=1447944 RepID=A0A6A4HFX1_9AGAR|nr:hypothetical protein BT96DRAFT_1021649 [Gymnopus androsaceus JB14]
MIDHLVFQVLRGSVSRLFSSLSFAFGFSFDFLFGRPKLRLSSFGYFWVRLDAFFHSLSPRQIIAGILTVCYLIRNLDKILGLTSPEPLVRLYSPSHYRATLINTAPVDRHFPPKTSQLTKSPQNAGFLTASGISIRWLRDICSLLFSVYYLFYAHEELRQFRAVPTLEMMRCTWEKTTNPILRFLVPSPPIKMRRIVSFQRPSTSTYNRPIRAWLFFDGSVDELAESTDLILDIPEVGQAVNVVYTTTLTIGRFDSHTLY